MASDILDELMSNVKDEEAFKLASQVSSLEDKLSLAGIDPGEAAPRENAISWLLDTLNAPGQGVRGIIDTAFRGDAFMPGVGIGWSRGQAENTSVSDILRRNDLIDNPALRGIAGIAGDIATDPLTYITFGTTGAAKLGGRVVTKSGSELADKVATRIASSGVGDFVKAEIMLDDAFRAAGDYSEITKDIQRLISNNASSTAIELKKQQQALALSRLQVTEDVLDETGQVAAQKITKLIDPSEITDDVFAKKGITIGASIPFLGNFTEPSTKKVAEEFFKDPGPISKFMRTLGDAWTPARFEKKLVIDDKTLNVMRNANDWAKENLASMMGAIESVPVVGDAVKLAKDTASKAYDSFQQIFNQKYFLGERNWDQAKHLNREKVGNKARALGMLRQTFSKEELLDDVAQRDAFLSIDNAIREATLSNLNPNKVSALGKRPEEVLARIANTGQFDETDIELFGKLVDSDVEKIALDAAVKALSNPALSQNARAIGLKALNMMQDIKASEASMGFNYNTVALYLPHRYQNIFDSSSAIKGGGSNYFKSRKYETAQQAFQDSGYVAETNLADILYKRAKFSLDKRAERAYWNRLVVENAVPLEMAEKLYKDAAINPGGGSAKMLASLRVSAPSVDMDLINKGALDSVRAQTLRRAADGSEEAKALLSLKEDEFAAKVHEDMIKAGTLPADAHLAQKFRGEVADVIKTKEGEFFLPQSIAKAWKENTASKDLVMSNPHMAPIARLLDTANNFFKTMATRPWPAYWSQNYFGDRFLQAMQGVEAMSPGLMARTMDVLAGKSALKLRSGYLDKAGLERIISQFEPGFTVDEFTDVINSASKLDVGALYGKAKPGAWAKAKSTLRSAEERLQSGFDKTYRINHLLHRLEQGDSLPDAITAAKSAYLDYSNLSPVEKSYFRRLFMFYGFTSQATKKALNSLITRPGDFTLQSHVVNGITEFFSDPNAAPTAEDFDNKLLNSQVMNEQLSHYLGRDKEGRAIYGRGFAAPINAVMQQFPVTLPRSVSVGEILSWGQDTVDGLARRQFATANPIIKGAAEGLSGKNLYFDAPLSSEFLRRIPSLNKAAQRITGLRYDELPVDLDYATKKFLRAVPNEKGSLTADPGRMWILANVIPGMSRLVSTSNTIANADVPTWAKSLRLLTGVNIENADVSKSFLSKRKRALQEEIKNRSVNDILGIQSGEIDLNAE